MDVKLHFIEKGSGQPLVLLHGNGEEAACFKHQIDFFSAHYRVIAIDTRGHGLSPRGEAPFTLVQFAADLHDFLEENQIEKPHLLGFSDGGNIALIFALQYAQMIDKLVLNGANLSPAGVKRTVQIPIEIGFRMARFFARFSAQAVSNAEMLGLMVQEPHIHEKELKKINNPTLVIAGTHDMIKSSHTELIYKSLPHAELAWITGNHSIAYQQPQAFNARVLQFLLS